MTPRFTVTTAKKQLLAILCLFSSYVAYAQSSSIQDDHAGTIGGVPVTVDVLANDSFVDCIPSLDIEAQGSLGTASIVGGKLVYTPFSSSAGADKVTYRVSCGGNVATANVSIYVATKPDNISAKQCFGAAAGNTFDMTQKYQLDGIHSMTTPIIGDIDGDGIVEILAPMVVTWNEGKMARGFKVANGKTGEEKFSFTTVDFETHGQAITMGDVDGDGKSEIFIQGKDMKIYCYNHLGVLKSGFTTTGVTVFKFLLTLADVNNDGVVELVAGPYIFNATTGKLLVSATLDPNGMGFGSPHNIQFHSAGLAAAGRPYYMYALVDIDGNATQELCAGNSVYDITITNNSGTAGNSLTKRAIQANTTGMTADAIDGQTVALDFDGDGELDLVVIGRQKGTSYFSNVTLEIYAWKPLTGEVMARKRITNQTTATIPYMGDLDGNGTPEIVFATQAAMFALTYDAASNGTDYKNMKQLYQYAPFGETAGFTVFDFNQDGKVEIVYRGTTKLYIVNGANPAQQLSVPITAYSGTVAEYPLVADVDGDGHAEIIVLRANKDWVASTDARGCIAVYGSATPGAWAPARGVWNQWAYNVVNINEDMTIPRYPVTPAMRFPNGKQPFNGFLQQGTLLNSDGDLFFPTPDATFEGVPGYTWRADNNTLEVKVTIRNIGDADLQAPVYASAYKNSIDPANKLATGSYASNIPAGATGELTIVIPDISSRLPITDIQIRLNDNDGTFPVQQQCAYTGNFNEKPLAQVPKAVNDTLWVRSSTPITVDVLGNDTYGCIAGDLSVSLVSPLTANGTVTLTGDKQLSYQSNDGFSTVDKVYYNIACSDSKDNSTAIVHLVIQKPVKVEVIGSGVANEGGTPNATADLAFSFMDNVTHGKDLKITYQLVAGGTAVLDTDFTLSPTPYTVILPAGQPSVRLTLTPTQNDIVQGSRSVTVEIVNIEEV